MVAHAYKPCTKESRQEDHRRTVMFKSCPGHIRDPVLKKKSTVMDTKEAEAGGYHEGHASHNYKINYLKK